MKDKEKGLLSLLPLRSEIKSGRLDNEAEILALAEEFFCAAADVYAVLEYAVAFGRYADGAIRLALAGEDGMPEKLQSLPLSYAREIRVFCENCELRIVRSGESFCWRLRRDYVEQTQGQELHVLDETHKIWGASKQSKIVDTSPWSFLTSRRGSAIWVPSSYGEHAEVGLRIRNYIEFASAKKENGIVHFVDERLLGFSPWPNDLVKEAQ